MEARWGKCLGRYELVAELGRGAMGVVYKARDPKIDRFVAVKTILLLGANTKEALEYRERFFQEAQAVGRLVHPGIVTVFDVGEEPENRIPYIVMEYIDGVSLRELLAEKGGKLPLDTALQLAEELAEALDCAHGQGIVHRDIKPANILVTAAGRAKITDFGIAKLDLDLTLPGHVLGTPAYMSPEQLNDEKVDGRSDLFSLGVILYSMISGYRPFQGNSVATVCFKLANHDPLPPSALDPDLPKGIDAIISRAIAKDPAERYQRGLEFALDVRELREGSSPPNHAKEQSFGSTAKGSRPGAAGLVAHGILNERIRLPFLRPNQLFQKAFRSAQTFVRVLARYASPPIVAVAVITIVLGLFTWHRWPYAVPGRVSKSVASVPPAKMNTGDLMPDPNADRAIKNPKDPEKSKTSQHIVRRAQTNSPDPTSDPEPAKRPSMVSAKPNAGTSTLIISVDHHFEEGSLSVWGDDKLLYSHSLEAEAKKHFVLFQTRQGHESSAVRLTAGEHQLRVRVRTSAGGDQLQSIPGTFARGQERTLQISFHGHHKDMRLDLR